MAQVKGRIEIQSYKNGDEIISQIEQKWMESISTIDYMQDIKIKSEYLFIVNKSITYISQAIQYVSKSELCEYIKLLAV